MILGPLSSSSPNPSHGGGPEAPEQAPEPASGLQFWGRTLVDADLVQARLYRPYLPVRSEPLSSGQWGNLEAQIPAHIARKMQAEGGG